MGFDESRMTSSSIINGVQSGDQDAWVRLTQRFGPLVFYWLKKNTHAKLQSHDYSDLSQEVFLEASKNIERYQHSLKKSGSFRAWLFGITSNIVRRYESGLSQHQVSLMDLSEHFSWDPEYVDEDDPLPEEFAHLKSGQTYQVIELVKAKSERHTWQAFWRTVVHGEAAVDVAADLGMTDKAVRQAKSRTILRIRRESQLAQDHH